MADDNDFLGLAVHGRGGGLSRARHRRTSSLGVVGGSEPGRPEVFTEPWAYPGGFKARTRRESSQSFGVYEEGESRPGFSMCFVSNPTYRLSHQSECRPSNPSLDGHRFMAAFRQPDERTTTTRTSLRLRTTTFARPFYGPG